MYVRESFPLALCRCGDRASCKSGLASGLLTARYAEHFSARCAIWKKPVQGSAPPTGSKKLGKFGKEQSSGQNQTRSMIFQSIYFNYLFGYFHSAWTSQPAVAVALTSGGESMHCKSVRNEHPVGRFNLRYWFHAESRRCWFWGRNGNQTAIKIFDTWHQFLGEEFRLRRCLVVFVIIR